MDINLISLPHDILGVIVGFLDDASYVNLHRSCTRLYHSLRSPYLLRVFFDQRCGRDITLDELRTGLRNIIRYTTYTFVDEKVLINHYLRTLEDRYLVDIFERVWLFEEGKFRPSTVRCSQDQTALACANIRSLPRYGFVHADTFTIARQDLDILYQLHHVQVLLQGQVLLYRQWNRDMIYFSYQGGFPYRHVVPIDQVAFILARAPPDWSESYTIDLILDRSGQLYLRSELILRDVKEIRCYDEEVVMLMHHGELRYYQWAQLGTARYHTISTAVTTILSFDSLSVQYLQHPHTLVTCNRPMLTKRVVAEEVILAKNEHCYFSQGHIRGDKQCLVPQPPVEIGSVYGHIVARCKAN